MGEQVGQMTMSVGRQTKNRLAESSEGLTELLPGIPDSITLSQIAPKLPWRAVRILSFVSTAWQRMVHSREVYKERVLAGSTETFVLLCHTLPEVVPREDVYSGPTYAISVYSVEDKRCYLLPAIPGLKRGIPRSCQCISLDNQVYILGGDAGMISGHYRGCKEVYKLDVAGKWEWERCADMQHGRRLFASGVVDEQLYVFGGRSDGNIVCESEVYDPKADAWSPVMPMMISRSLHQVTARGEDLVVHGGHVSTNPSHTPVSLEIYHPRRNEKRVVVPHSDRVTPKFLETMFLAHGKLYSLTLGRVFVLDIGADEYTLTHLHSLVPDKTLSYVNAYVARVVNGEVLALMQYYDRDAKVYTTFLLQSKGFGNENRDLMWEKAVCPLCFEHPATPFLCPIQL